jgi:hypothetical protein
VKFFTKYLILDVIDEKKLRQLIYRKFISDKNFYETVKKGELNRPMSKTI